MTSSLQPKKVDAEMQFHPGLSDRAVELARIFSVRLLEPRLHVLLCEAALSIYLRCEAREPHHSIGGSLAFVLLALVAATGCGDDRGLVPVSGKVTLDGQPMPGPGDLTFVPLEIEAGFPLRPAKAEFGPDGNYQAQSFAPGDGLYPGKYGVLVYCWEVPPTPNGPAAKSHIDQKYQSRAESGLVVNVGTDSRGVTYNIDL